MDSPWFSPTMKAFLHNELVEHKWQHDLREEYRKFLWESLARDRSQHYAGVERGINRRVTCLWLHQLQAEADIIQKQCDSEEIIPPEPKADPRVQLKVSRLLFSGGLQNPERTHRHKNKDGKVLCLCKQAEPSLQHISWYRSRFQHLRADMCAKLPCSVQQLPECFRSCAIVPTDFAIPDVLAIEAQQVLVQIWQ